MNENTRVCLFCYKGDQHQVEQLMPFYRAHGCPITVLSPQDSKVNLPAVENRHAGRAAYIGQPSLDRQRLHLEILLEYPEKFFFLADPDSFCLSPEFPARLYADGEGTLWSNECVEPRPHPSPYPKKACQPPYWVTRTTISKLLLAAKEISAHPITPFLDWAMLAWACHSGIISRPFTLLEHPTTGPVFTGTDSWQQLDYRIRHMGARFMHPIKEDWQIDLCRRAYEERDR